MGNPALASTYASQSVTLKNGQIIKGTPLVLYVTTIGGTPDQGAGVSFVKYLISPAGLRTYQKMGYVLLSKPVLKGDVNAIPTAIKSELR